jgi:hypothetical protein
VSRYDDFFDQLAERLEGHGFSVSRKIESGNDHYDLFAFRPDKFHPLWGMRTRYIIATGSGVVDGKMVREYSKRAFQFGLAHRKFFDPMEVGGSARLHIKRLAYQLFFPVIISDDITDELKAWLNKSMPEVHFVDAFECPVLISPKKREIYCFGRSPPVGGGVLYKGLVEFVESELGFH